MKTAGNSLNFQPLPPSCTASVALPAPADLKRCRGLHTLRHYYGVVTPIMQAVPHDNSE